VSGHSRGRGLQGVQDFRVAIVLSLGDGSARCAHVYTVHVHNMLRLLPCTNHVLCRFEQLVEKSASNSFVDGPAPVYVPPFMAGARRSSVVINVTVAAAAAAKLAADEDPGSKKCARDNYTRKYKILVYAPLSV
jgi:hypothetical protein